MDQLSLMNMISIQDKIVINNDLLNDHSETGNENEDKR